MTSPYKLQQTFCHRDGDPTFLRHDVRTELVHHLPVVFSSYSIPTTRSIDGTKSETSASDVSPFIRHIVNEVW